MTSLWVTRNTQLYFGFITRLKMNIYPQHKNHSEGAVSTLNGQSAGKQWERPVIQEFDVASETANIAIPGPGDSASSNAHS